MSNLLYSCKPSSYSVGVDGGFQTFTVGYKNGCALSKNYNCSVYKLTVDYKEPSLTLDFGEGCSVESYDVTSVTFNKSSLEVTYIDSNGESRKANFSYSEISSALEVPLGSVYVLLGLVKKRTHKLFSKLK